MSRCCPNCSAKLSPMLFFTPRLSHYQCPSCGIRIGYSGVFSWGIEIVFILLCLSVYNLVEGNRTQWVVLLPFAALVTVLQYCFANIKVIGGRK